MIYHCLLKNIKLQTTLFDKFGGPWTQQRHGNKTQQ